MHTMTIGSFVRLVDCVFPDGEDVTGVWQIVGRHDHELTLERYEQLIRVDASCVRSVRQRALRTLPAKSAAA